VVDRSSAAAPGCHRQGGDQPVTLRDLWRLATTEGAAEVAGVIKIANFTTLFLAVLALLPRMPTFRACELAFLTLKAGLSKACSQLRT
jgi:hypothetical protein